MRKASSGGRCSPELWSLGFEPYCSQLHADVRGLLLFPSDDIVLLKVDYWLDP